jgi:hypothetical protein
MAALSARARVPRKGMAAVALLLTVLVPHADAAAPPIGRQDTRAPELVVVLHGLGRSPFSMRPMVRALEAEGYDVLSYGYSSTCCAIPEIVDDLRSAVTARLRPEHRRVHFVGHSLGNILVRYLLASDSAPPRVSRVVMLAPPNQGALRANRMTPFVGWLLKPTPELRVDSTATVREIPRLTGVEIGVIAGREDDTVKLPETHLDEEKEHVVVDGGHTFIMNRRDVQRLTVAFLRSGTFGGPAAAVHGTRVTSSP